MPLGSLLSVEAAVLSLPVFAASLLPPELQATSRRIEVENNAVKNCFLLMVID
jgi:hypothetical protein